MSMDNDEQQQQGCKQHTKPCGDCAFRRDSRPGGLGGSHVTTYVGQVSGPFWIPCHCSKGYRGKQSEFGEEAECAGAATMRANLGLSEIMPRELLKVEPDETAVFSSFEEFCHHHMPHISLEKWKVFFAHYGPGVWLERELAQAGSG